eukprot:657843-Pleurochrysis_carterae.AAC.1
MREERGKVSARKTVWSEDEGDGDGDGELGEQKEGEGNGDRGAARERGRERVRERGRGREREREKNGCDQGEKDRRRCCKRVEPHAASLLFTQQRVKAPSAVDSAQRSREAARLRLRSEASSRLPSRRRRCDESRQQLKRPTDVLKGKNPRNARDFAVQAAGARQERSAADERADALRR